LTRTGATLANRYLLEESLGRGASGSVFRAKDGALGIPVVIKVLHEGLAQAHDVLERFKRELILARRVTHPGLCKVFDLQSEGETHFLVMEFIPGETLTTLLKREGKLEPARAIEIMRQASSAIGAAHKEGVVHRDLKPENIMVRPNGSISVLDFGIATQEGLDRLTRPGFVLGSRKYMAPELWTGHPPTPQSDVWSLGVILYGALCGRLPYRADGAFGVLDAIQSEERPKPSSLNPLVSPAVEAVIDRALNPEAGDRYPDASALERALVDVASAGDRTKVTKMPDFEGVTAPAVQAMSSTPRAIDLGIPNTNGEGEKVLDGGPNAARGEPAGGQTNIDRPTQTWESWANDAAAVASSTVSPDVATASALGAAFDAVLSAPEPVAQDTKITPADAWMRADAALGGGGAFPVEVSGERTVIGPAPLVDLSVEDPLAGFDKTMEATDGRNDLTEDLGRPRVRRDDQPTVFVRSGPEDPLERVEPAQRSSRKALAAAAVVLGLIGVIVLGVALDDSGEPEKVATTGTDITATSSTGGTGEQERTPPTDGPGDRAQPVEGEPAQPVDGAPQRVDGATGEQPIADDVAVGGEPSADGEKVEPAANEKLDEKVDQKVDERLDEKVDDEDGEKVDDEDGEKVDEKWDFDEPSAEAKPDVERAPRAINSAEDARERARLKKVAESVEKAMAAKGLVRGDVRAIDVELGKAKSAIKGKRYASADGSLERARALVDSTAIDGNLVAKKLARFNQRYDKVKGDDERAALGKLAVDIGKAMAKGDHQTANAKLNQALASTR